MSGRIVHFEIPFENGDRARGFYREAFGWTVQEMPDMQYTLVMTGPTTDQGMPGEPGFINGGMATRSEFPTRGPVLVVDVESVDAALDKVEKLGGKTAVAKQQVGRSEE